VSVRVEEASPFALAFAEAVKRGAIASQEDFAKRCGTAQATVSRCLSGDRRPSRRAYILLASLLPPPPVRLAVEHGRWLAKHRTPSFTFTHDLPADMGPEEAKRICEQAFADLATRGKP